MTLVTKSIFTFATEQAAMTAWAVLGEIFGEQAPFIVHEDKETWLVERYDDGALASNADLPKFLADAGLALCGAPSIEALPDADWVALSQQGLTPVQAGRFTVHGSHDAQLRPRLWAIEIDAGRAFGTAHHGTTSGCLIAIDRYARTVRRAGDLGTGSGVLTIAIAKRSAHCAGVLALDNDPVAVAVAKENCHLNGVDACVRLGVSSGAALRGGDFDLVTANILARPLIELAPLLQGSVRIGGLLVLSGMLDGQAREVVAAYLARGFAKVEVLHREGWATAVLRRRA